MAAQSPRSAPKCVRIATCLLLASTLAHGQDLEPRRWTHLPTGMNVFGLGVAAADGDLALDPVLNVEDATVQTQLQVASYVRSFAFLGKAARVDLLVPYSQGQWKGKLDGIRRSTRRRGFADPRIRLSVDLVGAPALKGKEYKEFREAHPVNTVVGTGVSVSVPWGQYKEDTLLNLGQNRYIIRPELGVLHTRGPWSYELTGSTFLFTKNNDLLGTGTLEQDPVHTVQSHVVRTLPHGWWVSAGVAYGWGGRSTVNGVRKDDEKGDILSGASFGFPVAENQGVKFAYVRRRTLKDVGVDNDALVASWSVRF